MVKITEEGSIIVIEIEKKAGLDTIYNSDFFSLLDLEVVDSNKDNGIKNGGNKSIVNDIIDKSEEFVNSRTDTFNKNAEGLINSVEKSLLESQDNIIRIQLKRKSQTKITSLDEVLNQYIGTTRGIFDFKSGLRYIDLENIVKDIYIQLSYIDFLNIKITGLSERNIYKINGRYLFLTNEDAEEKNVENEFNIISEFQRLIAQLMGEKYEKGRILDQIKLIDKTRLYKFVNRMNDGLMNIW